jgi:N-acetylneuraminate synthase
MSNKTFIIAEAGVNHNGSLDMARQLIDAAADAGADAVKFQTFRAERLAIAHAPKADYQIATTGGGESQFEMLKRLELTDEAHRQLLEHSRMRGIEFMSTAFDIDSLHFLVSEIGVKRIKLPSGEITNGPFLLEAARSGLPLILSTGMSDLADIRRALSVLAFGLLGETAPPSIERFNAAQASERGQQLLKANVIVLQCVTEYPAPIVDANLRAMKTIASEFQLSVGYSDHTLGLSASLAAVALGATMIEKHFTLDSTLPGPDHRASLEPADLKTLVIGIRDVEASLGDGQKVPTAAELKNVAVARKSLAAARPVRKGDIFTPDAIAIKRPGSGRSPMDYWTVLGTAATRDYRPDELIE